MAEGKPAAGRGRGPRDPAPANPVHLVVRFRDEMLVPAAPDVADDLPGWLQEAWAEFRKSFPGIAIRPLFGSIDPDAIRRLIEGAEARDPAFVAPEFHAYFSVWPAAEADIGDLRRRLVAWDAVRHVEVSRPVPDPSPLVNDNPDSDKQGYLNPAKEGINALHAWTIAGGKGSGQHLVDVERGWLLDHEDLQGIAPSGTIHGAISAEIDRRSHGTMVLGVVCARDNDKGGIGIAPGLAKLGLSSYENAPRAPAIMAAAIHLALEEDRGVLLIEAQEWADEANQLRGPVEISDPDYDVIRTAVSGGIVVVEVGGNGTKSGDVSSAPALDMDTYEREGEFILSANPEVAGYRDSGAIIVSAADPETREPLSYAPRGQRIDCYAWGDDVHTCVATIFDESDKYTPGFAGTSSAAAIIAGAALSLLGIARANGVEQIGPEDVREILRDRSTGTLPADDPSTDEPYRIGVMPDLEAILDSLTPNLTIRDLVPVRPHRHRLFTSPDIIVRARRVDDPQAEFGAGSGTEDATDLSGTPQPGRDNHVYVRILNRGGWSASNVEVTAHWSPAATLVTPSSWRLIGSTVIPVVPAGNVLTVAEIVWNAADVPGGIPCCFVAEADTALDPSPVSAAGPGGEWRAFWSRILRSDNLAWRNLQTMTFPPFGGTASGAFLFRGAPDVPIETRLEVDAVLPWNAHAALVTPASSPVLLSGPALLPRRPGETRRWAIRKQGRTKFDRVEVPAGARIPMVLEVSMAWPRLARSYWVTARQRVRRRVVGQVTWKLVQGPHP